MLWEIRRNGFLIMSRTERRVPPGTPLTLEDARRLVAKYVQQYNEVRLHSALGYIAPADKLAGREAEIFASRDAKLDEARQLRAANRQRAKAVKNSNVLVLGLATLVGTVCAETETAAAPTHEVGERAFVRE